MTKHLTISIAGLEERLKNNEMAGDRPYWQILEHKNGKFLTKEEVYAEIERCKKFGYSVIPTCDRIDIRGYCRGHNYKEVEIGIHDGKQAVWGKGIEIGLTGDALSMFSHVVGELKVKLQVDIDTGKAEIINME